MPWRRGPDPVMNVGHTAPLPMWAGDVTRPHAPRSMRAPRQGSSPRAIRARTSVDSAASIPTATTGRRSDGLTEELPRVDPPPLDRRPGAGLEHRHGPEVVAPVA